MGARAILTLFLYVHVRGLRPRSSASTCCLFRARWTAEEVYEWTYGEDPGEDGAPWAPE